MKKQVFISVFVSFFCLQVYAFPPTDSERLGMAIEYFQSGKYHEALLIFQRLDREYKLNPRFRGYIGVCYYYEWNYEQACRYLDAMIPLLETFAPHERAVYYHSAAESHFQLRQYQEAIPLYERFLTVCYNNEKPDALCQLGFCYMFAEDWINAHDYFQSSFDYYKRFRDTPEQQPRIRQIQNMIKGCEERMEKNKSYPISASPGERGEGYGS